jgi:hypothetical protein
LGGYVGLQLVEGSCSCGAGCAAVDSPEYPKQWVWDDAAGGQPFDAHKEVIRVSGLRLGVYWAKLKE